MYELQLKFNVNLFLGGLTINIPSLVQMDQPSDKPLPETMMISLLMHICVTQPQWFNRVVHWNMKHIAV